VVAERHRERSEANVRQAWRITRRCKSSIQAGSLRISETQGDTREVAAEGSV
jgi:hypothetical protein